MKGDHCTKEKELGMLLEATKNFKHFMDVMENNHLKSIYAELKAIREKMSTYRPPWSIVLILSGLMTITGILVTLLVKR